MGAFDLPEIILTIFIILIIAIAVYFIVKKVKKSRNSDSYTPGSDKNEESENFNEGQIISQSYDGTYWWLGFREFVPLDLLPVFIALQRKTGFFQSNSPFRITPTTITT